MTFDEKLADRIREALAYLPDVKEQIKMGGISFLVNGKMCIRAHPNGEMMLRCEPDMTDDLLTKKGARRFEMKGKPMMKGWLLISPEGTKNKKDFEYWIGIALDYNKSAKAAPKRKK